MEKTHVRQAERSTGAIEHCSKECRSGDESPRTCLERGYASHLNSFVDCSFGHKFVNHKALIRIFDGLSKG